MADNTTRLIPGSWLDAYLAFTAESESPEEYHLWVGLSCISAALRRKCFFNMGYFLLYPNLYIVLVGPAGRCKKSTAMRIGRAIAGTVPGLEFSVDSTTRERMIMDLSQAYKDGQSATTVHSTEFASLLTSSGMDMVVFLTDIFDCPSEWTHKTKGGGTNKIKAPYLNLLGAATPEWIAKGLPLDTIGIGLTSRIIFIFQDTPRARDPFPELTPAQEKIQQYLINDLACISQIAGEYKFDAESKEAYRHWYKERFDDPNPSGDPRLSGYYERKPMHLIKLCMIVSASKRDDLVITMEDYVQALKLFERVEPHMQRVFSAIGRNPIYADQEAMLWAFSESNDGFSLSDLLDRFGYNVRKEEVEEILDTLMTAKKITLGANGRYYFNKPRGTP